MEATKLPFGNLPRLLLAWVSTEAVRTQSRKLVLGRSLSEFMRALGVYSSSGGRGGVQTRLRNQDLLGGKSVDYHLAADVTFKKAQQVRYEPSEKQQDLPLGVEPPGDRNEA